ncbi:hypothetical protein Z950_2670 [Sulfitobacter mediterraneus KCTC 32188]|nr:hypothetical protein Z950_2670 [Sulfitobacter mediterraneus KCTC 32188]
MWQTHHKGRICDLFDKIIATATFLPVYLCMVSKMLSCVPVI